MGHHHHHHHQNLHRRSTYLPMLCAPPSIKDVSLSNWRNRSADLSTDPISPRVGCTGQVKRNNRVSGFPTTAAATATAAGKSKSDNIKFVKLKKFLSSKNLLSSTTPASRSGRRLRKIEDRSSDNYEAINLAELDPPLPVMKRPVQQPGGGMNLWKRRSDGNGLKTLQRIQIPKHHHLLQPTSVWTGRDTPNCTEYGLWFFAVLYSCFLFDLLGYMIAVNVGWRSHTKWSTILVSGRAVKTFPIAMDTQNDLPEGRSDTVAELY